nr:integrase, catalytic region, zinc finger, CCHC-type, peptidase aspartic, catalytic [Tanacetum cinerariifolium]
MSTQQDIYAAGSESRPLMLNKENYMPWSSRLLRYAKSRPNGKLIHNSIINGPYVKRMIPEPGDTNRDVPMNETFHVQTDDERTEKELKQIEADDQAIQTILLGLPEDIYAAVDSYKTAQEIWLRVQQIMKGSDIGIQEKKGKLFNEYERFTSNEGESIESSYYPPHQDQPSFNQNYMQEPMPNPEDITNPTTAMNMALALMAKAFKLNYSTPTNNNQRISSNPRNRQIAQPGINMGQDRQMQMVGGNANLNGNGNLVAARAEGNATGPNGNQIRCYNCKGVEEYDLMAAAADLDEIKEVNANCILMANLQQASTSGTQTDKAPVYDLDGSAEVHDYENYDDNDIFNMFTQEEQYTKLLEPIPEQHQVPQNDNNVISEEAAKFIGDFKSLAKEDDESLAKHKALELEIKRLLRAVVSDEKDNTHDTSANTKFAKQSIMENLPTIGETHALSKPVTSNSDPTPQESKVMKNDKVIAPGMFRINPFKTSREEKHVPNNISASVRTKPITISQPSIITKKELNSDSNGFSSTGVDNTKTRRPQPRSNTKNDRVPSASKSSRSKNKEAEVEEHHRNLLLSKNYKHISSACNNNKIDSQNVISKVVCAMCKQCLISVNHDVCLCNYVNGKTSRGKKHKANVSIKEKQKKHQPQVIQICLWSVDSGCSKHMTGNLKLLINFVWKFMGTVRFRNDHVAAILGFGDLQWGSILITRVYFVEGLGHNLFSVGQFRDSDL